MKSPSARSLFRSLTDEVILVAHRLAVTDKSTKRFGLK